MVITEDTCIVTQPKQLAQAQPSIKRWLKHFLHIPSTKRFFSRLDQHAITQAVKQAERGHVGEIQVVIEGCLPASQAYHCDALMRARQLFAALGVWDTQFNSGVLLYLNICDRQVEIVVDRGLKHAIDADVWQQICQQIVQDMAQQHYRQALVDGILHIGDILAVFYQTQEYVETDNELGNAPIMLG